MQMHAMNQYGNRGFGGPPQPQRQGGRRGFNRGGFRNSRFEHNQHQRGPNFPGGQRPHNEPVKQGPQNEKPPQQQQQQQQPQPQQQQAPPKEKEAVPQQTPPPQQQQPTQKPQQAAPKPPQQPQTPKPPQNQPQVQTPSQPTPKPESQDHVDKSTPEPRQQNQNHQGSYQKGPIARLMDIRQEQGPNNVNGGNFGGNKQGGVWSQGGPGNKPPGNFGPKGFGPKQGGQGPARNQQRNNMNRGPQDGGKPQQREFSQEQMLANKLKDLMGPLTDIAPIEQPEVKFNGRSRLYIGNLTNDVTEEEIQNMFGQFGETAELFINKEKNFGFIKMDYRVNAEKAKREIDGRLRNGRNIRVRFAPHNSAVRVKNLPPFVSNELLYRAFEIFGKIERAYVKVDDRGKTLGEGIVEFARKPSALAAIRNCTERCFFLTSSLRPVIVESLEEPDEFDGYPEKNLPKKHPEFLRAREMGPRFSEPSSFEHEYGTRWKQLHELHRQKEEALKKELAAEEEKLEAQMEYAKYEHETELLREQLRQREQDRERQKRSWEMAERAADERRDAERAQLLRQEEELSTRMRLQDDELRRRQQENTLFVQAQRLNSMLDRQEQGMFDHQQPMDGGFREQFDMPRGGYDDMQQNRGWEGPRQMDDFPNKRRRF